MDKLSAHWDAVFELTDIHNWSQLEPLSLLKCVEIQFTIPPGRVIEVGSGDGRVIDSLLRLGVKDITAVDISQVALSKLNSRLGKDNGYVRYVHSNILVVDYLNDFKLWIDRAVFHFFTQRNEIEAYKRIMSSSLQEGGIAIIAAFGSKGPKSSSGLPTKNYEIDELKALFESHFDTIDSMLENHYTPYGECQQFVYVVLRKRKNNESINHYDNLQPPTVNYVAPSVCSLGEKKCCG